MYEFKYVIPVPTHFIPAKEMRILTSLTALFIALAAGTKAVSAQSVCAMDYQGTDEDLRVAQEDSIANFGRLFLVEKDAQQAFDLYIPG